MKLLQALFLIPLLLPACGKLQSERKPFDSSKFQAATTSQALSSQDFASACAAKPGILEANNTLCIYVSGVKVLSEGSGHSDTTQDVLIGQIPAGAAVHAMGSAQNNAVEIVLNGTRIAGVPTNRPVTTGGGTLSFRLRPGSYYGVKAYVYTCLNQAMQTVRCPY